MSIPNTGAISKSNQRRGSTSSRARPPGSSTWRSKSGVQLGEKVVIGEALPSLEPVVADWHLQLLEEQRDIARNRVTYQRDDIPTPVPLSGHGGPDDLTVPDERGASTRSRAMGFPGRRPGQTPIGRFSRSNWLRVRKWVWMTARWVEIRGSAASERSTDCDPTFPIWWTIIGLRRSARRVLTWRRNHRTGVLWAIPLGPRGAEMVIG